MHVPCDGISSVSSQAIVARSATSDLTRRDVTTFKAVANQPIGATGSDEFLRYTLTFQIRNTYYFNGE
jgi:hypothetical protein